MLLEIEKIALFLFVLSALITIHEYGHYYFARLFKAKVNEFSIGMGPALYQRLGRNGVLFSLRAIPIGGYCAIEGENAEQGNGDELYLKPAWQRLLVFAGGPLANILGCLVLLFGGTFLFGVQSTNHYDSVMGPIKAGWPAARAGLHAGDRIVRINGQRVTGDQIYKVIHASRGQHLTIEYNRAGTTARVSVVPQSCSDDTHAGCIGYDLIPTYERASLGTSLAYTWDDFVYIAGTSFESIKLIASHPKKYAGQVSGVVGMGAAASTVQDFGGGYYIRFAALISFALGAFNLLPIPALDGGRILFVLPELLFGIRINPKREAFVHTVAFAVLLAAMLLINGHDIVQILFGHNPY